MPDDEDTSRGGSGNTSDNEGGYDSSGSYLDIDESCISSIDYCYSEEENYVSENDDTCDEDKTKRLSKDISAAISERGVPDSEMVSNKHLYSAFFSFTYMVQYFPKLSCEVVSLEGCSNW
ncbi:hypothetical protein MKW92_017383, partial [Papaver armeniacum]